MAAPSQQSYSQSASLGLPPMVGSTPQPDATASPLAGCICRRDIAGARYWLARGAELNKAMFSYTTRDGRTLEGLTATALSVAVDSDNDGILMTSLMLNYGGRADHVDDDGRCLLAFSACHALSAYLVDWGATSRGGKLGQRAELCGPPIPRSEWEDVLRAEMVQAMVGAGYHEPPEVRCQRDPFAQAFAPDLIARFSPSVEIEYALIDGKANAVARCLELGAERGTRRYPWPVERTSRLAGANDLTIGGLAVVLDCAAERRQPGAPSSGFIPTLTSIVLPWIDRAGPHTGDGATLMHLADAPGVSAWLIEQGCPVDLCNKGGLLPEEVVPENVRPGLVRARFTGTFPQRTTVKRPARAKL